ncbi:ATP-binding cassette domain-containing protein, partial [Enterococcus faecium]|uniref:ATP-binding cassette domain-containing protein n=1 Tax=Enterococcus faecium TaxID=1352 RepID=UPI003CC56E1C
ILSTLDKPTDGHIRINQKVLNTLKGNQLADFRANEIGFIFQDFNILESLTAQENIAVPLSIQGVRPKEIKQRVQKIAERLSIS